MIIDYGQMNFRASFKMLSSFGSNLSQTRFDISPNNFIVMKKLQKYKFTLKTCQVARFGNGRKDNTSINIVTVILQCTLNHEIAIRLAHQIVIKLKLIFFFFCGFVIFTHKHTLEFYVL